jgi:predicted O-methyltransferase YrrM
VVPYAFLNSRNRHAFDVVFAVDGRKIGEVTFFLQEQWFHMQVWLLSSDKVFRSMVHLDGASVEHTILAHVRKSLRSIGMDLKMGEDMQTAQTVRDAFGYLYQAELDLLRELVLDLPPNPVIVNIGAGAGTSGLLFLETRPDTIVYTIDIQNASSPLGCLTGERRVVDEAGLSHLLGHRWFQLEGRSQEIGKIWMGLASSLDHLEVDLLFIDGDHSFEGCMGDLMAWHSHVNNGGLIAVHDYDKEGAWVRQNPGTEVTDRIRGEVIKPFPGVDQAVRAFFGDTTPDFLADSLAVFRVSRTLHMGRWE